MNLKRLFWTIAPVLFVLSIVSIAQAVDDITPPAAITNLSVTSATSTSVALSWTAPGDDGAAGTAAFYDLRYRTAGPIDETNFATSTPVAGEPAPHAAGSAEIFTVHNLIANTAYWFGMRTTDDAGNTSGLSNIVSTTTPMDGAAPIISGVMVTDITTSGAKVKWATNEVGSSLVRYGTTTGYGLMVSVGGMLLNHEVPLAGLSPSTLYHFAVSSADNFGNTATSSDSTFTTRATSTPDTAAPIISGITVTDITQTSAKVRWNTNESSNSLVRYGTTTTYGLSNSLGANVISHIVPLSGLTPLTSYHFAVSSADPSGNTATSSDHLFTTLATSTPATSTIQARLQMEPRTINRARKGKKITAVVRLPKGVTFEGLDTESILLNGSVKPIDLKLRRKEWNRWGRVRRTLIMKFNSDDILPLIPTSTDQFIFTVTGKVKHGTFTGSDTVRIIPKVPKPKPTPLPKIEKRMEEIEDRLDKAKERLEDRKEDIEKRKEEIEKQLEKKKEELERKQEDAKKKFEKSQEELKKKMEKLKERDD